MYAEGDPEPLTEAEAARLVEEAKDHSERKELTVRVLLRTGLRAGELAHLKPGWLREGIDRNFVRVPSSEDCGDPCCADCMRRTESALESWCRNPPEGEERPDVGSDAYEALLAERRRDMWRPKSPAGERKVPFGAGDLWDRFEAHVRAHDGWSCGRHAILYRVKRVAEGLDVAKPVTSHILRHTYCNQLAEDGAKADVIQDLAGHADISSSEAYLSPSDERKAETVEESAVSSF